MILRADQIQQKISVMTILGQKYHISYDEMTAWFRGWRYGFYVALVYFILIFVIPHNERWELSIPDRLIFWSILYFTYTALWLMSIRIGVRYALGSPQRIYVIPLSLVVIAIILSMVSWPLRNVMTDYPVSMDFYLLVEILNNILFVGVLEALFFVFVVPYVMNRQSLENEHHEWESL